MASAIQIAKKFAPLVRDLDKYRYWILYGSTRSGKTWSIWTAILAYIAQHPGTTVAISRWEARTAKRTLIPDFKQIVNKIDYPYEYSINMQEGEIHVPELDARIVIIGAQDEARLHGLACNVLWLNEVMEIPQAPAQQMRQRCTGPVIIDFNPSLSEHWIWSLVDVKRQDVCVIHSTYKDNPHLTPAQVAEIESYEPTPENIKRGTADEYMWQVYGLGKKAVPKGRIFRQWTLVDDNEWPEENACKWIVYGLDFGYASDPTALVECALHNGKLYIRTLIYENELLIAPAPAAPNRASLVGYMQELGIPQDAVIVADSSAPESIETIRGHGYVNITSCAKYPGSVVEGIKLMQRYPLVIPESDLPLRRELEQYTWRIKPGVGQIMPQPIDAFNHAIDAARYAVTYATGALAEPERARNDPRKYERRLPRQARSTMLASLDRYLRPRRQQQQQQPSWVSFR